MRLIVLLITRYGGGGAIAMICNYQDLGLAVDDDDDPTNRYSSPFLLALSYCFRRTQ